jgi:transposase
VKIENINVDEALADAKRLIESEKDLSPAIKACLNMLIMLVGLLMNRIGTNSRNSSKPPSADPNRKKQPKSSKGNKPGGQNGHKGNTLTQVDNPDEIEEIQWDRSQLPEGKYKRDGYEKRQVFDIRISRVVTEYRAEVLIDELGKRFVAPFPEGVSKAVQYGNKLKAHAVYLSQFQLLPYSRLEDYFKDQLNMPISAGTLYNFNQQAYDKLSEFEAIAKENLIQACRINVDETGVNIGGKRLWLHGAGNDFWTHYHADEKRGAPAMEAAGIIPNFNGTLCHDHWKPYYQYQQCEHSLCNAHHLRELTRAHEQDKQEWAEEMQTLLLEINKDTQEAGGCLDATQAEQYKNKYKALLEKAQLECPAPKESDRKEGQRGRLKRSKARNLLERFIDYQDDVLRFMTDPDVPFTNNLGENDIRMTKVQQKISGCFRSMDGAKIFCRVRGYLVSCRKHDVDPSEAMTLLFDGQLPEFAR